MSAQASLLPGNRLHLNHGPIDLVISADSDAHDVRRAYQVAAAMFPNILPELVAKLAILRAPIDDVKPMIMYPIARRMVDAVWPYRNVFVTPMAAVAGAVADHVLDMMVEAAPLRRVIVNNGGDIAIHLADGQSVRAGVIGDLSLPRMDATIEIASTDPVRGIATSGWRGRSQSLGIADSVTVLAQNTAMADAAATMIANDVVVDDPVIGRLPAREVRDNSDLGDLPVTVAVGLLSSQKVAQALENGARRAAELQARGLIAAAYLQLQDQVRVVGAVHQPVPSRAA
ncbi:UPF0280 family protein [Dongia deserti]|uniref:UPF0280 family protein n=1 Tax=Dongia deserti TaxID=2268030 RepID=UPI000E65E75A|nr:UPF0280 family protein [Dongia deserti]